MNLSKREKTSSSHCTMIALHRFQKSGQRCITHKVALCTRPNLFILNTSSQKAWSRCGGEIYLCQIKENAEQEYALGERSQIGIRSLRWNPRERTIPVITVELKELILIYDVIMTNKTIDTQNVKFRRSKDGLLECFRKGILSHHHHRHFLLLLPSQCGFSHLGEGGEQTKAPLFSKSSITLNIKLLDLINKGPCA